VVCTRPNFVSIQGIEETITTTEIAPDSAVDASAGEPHVWMVFLDLQGTDPHVEVFATEKRAHERAAGLAGSSSSVGQADGSTCYQDGAGNFYTVRKAVVQG
jgi:hypothetical protein